MPEISEEALSLLREFFSRAVAAKATKPLRDGIEIALCIADAHAVTLTKTHGLIEIHGHPPPDPDITFRIPINGLKELCSNETNDVGEIGVAILKLMAHGDPAYRITARVSIGPLVLFRNGYLAVLPLGGPSVMKFLASKGLSGLGKIKEAISRLRE